MALDPEELKRRRAQRQAQKAQRQRRFWLRMGIAAGVLVLCAVLIFVLLPKGNQPASRGDAVTAPDQTAATEDTLDTTIHLAFAGDLNITDDTVDSGNLYDYTSVFMDVLPIFAEADLAALNFEGNLCGIPYGTDTASAPQSMAEALKNMGVDMVQLANSYAISRGISGLSTTIDGIRQAGMEPLGVYANQAAFQKGKGYTVKTVEGIKIAFVAFTKGMDGMALPPGSEDCVNVLYKDYESTYHDIDTEGITAIIDAAKQAQPDLIVALVHWGSEYNEIVSESQKNIAALLQKLGVQAIIGTHSHFVQTMSFDQETGNFVAYSLGDFLGDAQRPGTQYSVILDLEVTKDAATGNTAISGYTTTPIYTVRDEGLRVLRTQAAIDAYEVDFMGSVSYAVYEDMKSSLDKLETRMAEPEE